MTMLRCTWFTGLLLLSACQGQHDEPAGDAAAAASDDALLSSVFDRNTLITDAEMLDTNAVDAAKLDAFLARPYPQFDNEPSCLAKLRFGGKSVGTILVEQARANGLSALFLLTHLQKESSLVGQTGTCSADLLEQAFGCGCPDGSTCDPAYAGFEKQTACAATLTRSYLDDLVRVGHTVSGWAVGTAKSTLDPQTVKPTSRAAAVLYTYTPWVGDRTAGGNQAPFGNYLFWKTYTEFAKTLGYRGAAGGTRALGGACTQTSQCNGGKSGTERVCSANSFTCIAACHDDTDCRSGTRCDRDASWKCVAPVASDTSGDLNVPYECQNDNGTGLGGSTCQITSAAMVLRYWGAKGKGSGRTTKALDLLNHYGDYEFAKSPAGVARIFEDFGLYARSTESGTVAEMKQHLDAGRPLVVNGFFTHGHVVVFTGYDATGFFVNDPNGDWNGAPYVGGSQSYAGTSCPGTSGKGIHISFALLESTNVICTNPGPCYEGGSGVWFAVADATAF